MSVMQQNRAMTDVENLLAAIEETQRNAEAMQVMRVMFQQARRNGHTVMADYFTRHNPDAVLRRCAQDWLLVEEAHLALSRRPSGERHVQDLRDREAAVWRTVLRGLRVSYGLEVEAGVS